MVCCVVCFQENQQRGENTSQTKILITLRRENNKVFNPPSCLSFLHSSYYIAWRWAKLLKKSLWNERTMSHWHWLNDNIYSSQVFCYVFYRTFSYLCNLVGALCHLLPSFLPNILGGTTMTYSLLMLVFYWKVTDCFRIQLMSIFSNFNVFSTPS